MTLIENVFLGFLGLSFGLTVSAGIFAFITMLDVIPRLTHRTGTAVHLYGYENTIILGGTLGNIMFLFVRNFPVSIGCLAMALAESLRVIPIFVKRLKLKEGLPVVLVAIALGKLAGTIYQYFFK